ncbi:GAF domain-containing protein [Streptomyces sp. NPDC056660]|uniref:GAF domain-containing protein n=1 Tax=Streptomyces sp. NPDC056660 TaxID=3345897 RepID=UPI00368E5303
MFESGEPPGAQAPPDRACDDRFISIRVLRATGTRGAFLAAKIPVTRGSASDSCESAPFSAFAHGAKGACVDCYHDGQPRINVSLADPTATTRWPQFARSAQDTGFISTNALPLRLRGRVIGALSLFRAGPEPLAEEDLTLAQALADVATIAILQQRTLAHSEAERDQLQYAFGIFRAHARAHNRALSDLARAVADGTQGTDPIRAFPWRATETDS